MLFDYNVDRAVEDLNKSLLSYFVLATESSQSRGLRPVLVPASSSREVGLQPKRQSFLMENPSLVRSQSSRFC
jgi:hypothetical protein